MRNLGHQIEGVRVRRLFGQHSGNQLLRLVETAVLERIGGRQNAPILYGPGSGELLKRVVEQPVCTCGSGPGWFVGDECRGARRAEDLSIGRHVREPPSRYTVAQTRQAVTLSICRLRIGPWRRGALPRFSSTGFCGDDRYGCSNWKTRIASRLPQSCLCRGTRSWRFLRSTSCGQGQACLLFPRSSIFSPSEAQSWESIPSRDCTFAPG